MDMRVPAIFWWPGTLAPGTVSDIGSTMDVYVTALALAGADPTTETDGFDLSATLTRGAPSPRSSLAYYRQGELRAYRHGPWKLHLVTEGAYRQPPERAEHDPPLLYHLGEDPGERFDVAARHPEIVAEIQALIAEHRANLPEKLPLFDARLGQLVEQPTRIANPTPAARRTEPTNR
jgi:arylsulfatase A-like enzyme